MTPRLPRLDFDVPEYEARQARVRSAMEAAGIDILLVTHPASIHYLVGCRTKGFQELQCLLFTLEPGLLTLLTRITEVDELRATSLAADIHGWGREPENPVDVLATLLRDKGWLGRRFGLEVPPHYVSVQEHRQIRSLLGDALVLDGARLVEAVRRVKSQAEIASLRKAAAIADRAMETMLAAARSGGSELELAGEVQRTLMAQGGDQPPTPISLSFGSRTAYAHPLPSGRRLAAGEMVRLEVTTSYRRYTTALARQLSLGPAGTHAREIYDVVRMAVDSAIAAIAPGVASTMPNEAAGHIIAEAGLGAFRGDEMSYNLGIAFPPLGRERPLHPDGDRDTLTPGMVLAVSPAVFLPDEGIGVRLVESVLVIETGAEPLSHIARDLVEL